MPSEIPFYFMAAVIVGGALAAMSMRNLVHCALGAALSFVGLAGIYLQLNAEFVGWAQLLVYVGAVAILIIFTVLLTRGSDVKAGSVRVSSGWMTGLSVALVILGCLILPIITSPNLKHAPQANVSAPVKKIGLEMMTECVLPLETAGLLLTAALIGAVVIALNEKPAPRPKMEMPPRRGNIVEISFK